jgi:membrane-associated protease RseP (regulator of RpoE activity)
VNSDGTLRDALLQHVPGDVIRVKTAYKETIRSTVEEREYVVELADKGDGTPVLGISLIGPPTVSGLRGFVYKVTTSIKNPTIYYESKIGELGTFIYDLLWWVALISASVALMNMLPLGIFDGGRFFFLTVWGITGNKRAGEIAFKISTWVLLGVLFLLMAKWAIAVY